MTQHLLRLGIGCSQVDSQVEFVSLKILKQSATVQHARDYSGIDWATLEKCIEFMFQEYKTNSEGLRQELAGFAVVCVGVVAESVLLEKRASDVNYSE
ncbi:uncharacterized protein LODBEIA_P04490 [Lodderomyces beijingensis]|uniref:Uncharacterized protein n=1 Tax=Lodderomyces beijingensis TaxID=1775926 RepID=A0ABP0ZIR2_9ASCO